MLSSASERVADLVNEERRGEAMGWYGSSMTAGTALGAPVAGLAIDVIGPWSGFLMAGGAASLLVLVTLTVRRFARRPEPVL